MPEPQILYFLVMVDGELGGGFRTDSRQMALTEILTLRLNGINCTLKEISEREYREVVSAAKAPESPIRH